MNEHNIKVLFASSPEFPKSLTQIPQTPPIIYCIGNLDLLKATSVAMIGSRRCTRYGIRCASKISKELSQNGVCIVSGMAEGIDAASHSGGLEAEGKTIAVLGGGVDFIYPSCNAELYKKICQNGLVISEYPLSTRPKKQNFPERNRIVAGLAKCVIVVEAGMPSGTLGTVDHANEQSKTVFAVPGNIDSPSSKGTNYLIKNGCLCLTQASDCLEELGITPQAIKKKRQVLPKDELQRTIVELLKLEDMSADEIILKTGMSAETVSAALMMLEISGYIENHAGNEYSLNR